MALIIKTKREVKFHVKIAAALKEGGFDVEQARLACQSAANDIEGKEGVAKIGDVKKKSQGKEVGWREQIPVTFEGKISGPMDFLSWHDAMAKVFNDHGEPNGDLTVDIFPVHHHVWLALMKRRKEEKAKGGVAMSPAGGVTDVTRKGGKAGAARANGPTETTSK